MIEASPSLEPASGVYARVSVDAPIEHAFQVFTGDFGRWWPRSYHLGSAPLASAIIEPRIGGRWYELDDDGTTCDWGMVLVWNPPFHVALSWHLSGDVGLEHQRYASRIDIRFTSRPDGSTDVELVHAGLDVHGDGRHRRQDRASVTTRAA